MPDIRCAEVSVADIDDQVELRALALECIVGILPRERVTPQPLVFDVSVGLALEMCGDTGDLSKSIDYAAIETWLTTLAQAGQFWLIESMALAAVRGLLLPPGEGEARAAIRAATVSIAKPTILGGRAVPSVRVSRRAPVQLACVAGAGARCAVLVRTPRDGAWRLELADGATWVAGPEIGGCVMAGRVNCGGTSVEMGGALARGVGKFTAVGGPAVLWLAGTPVTDDASGAYAR
jgi:FolB domain-containing protein